MARLIFRLINDNALRRERLIRDRNNPLEIYDDVELVERFRFPRGALIDIIEEITPDIRHLSDRNGALSPAQQTLIALRFYANGAFQNTAGDMINVHKSTACRAIRRVSLALQSRLNRYVHLPSAQEAVAIKQRFMRLSGLPGIIGCIDGTHIRIQGPTEHENDYENRKGYHSINVQVVCDDNYMIMDLVAR